MIDFDLLQGIEGVFFFFFCSYFLFRNLFKEVLPVKCTFFFQSGISDKRPGSDYRRNPPGGCQRVFC